MKELEELKSLLNQAIIYLRDMDKSHTNRENVDKWRRYVAKLQSDYDEKLETSVVMYLNDTIIKHNG